MALDEDLACDCDLCGKEVDPKTDYAVFLSCANRTCGKRLYHQECRDRYLKREGFHSRQTGFPCPRGFYQRSPFHDKACKGKIDVTHERVPNKGKKKVAPVVLSRPALQPKPVQVQKKLPNLTSKPVANGGNIMNKEQLLRRIEAMQEQQRVGDSVAARLGTAAAPAPSGGIIGMEYEEKKPRRKKQPAPLPDAAATNLGHASKSAASGAGTSAASGPTHPKHGKMAHMLAEELGHKLEDLPRMDVKAAFGQHAVDLEKYQALVGGDVDADEDEQLRAVLEASKHDMGGRSSAGSGDATPQEQEWDVENLVFDFSNLDFVEGVPEEIFDYMHTLPKHVQDIYIHQLSAWIDSVTRPQSESQSQPLSETSSMVMSPITAAAAAMPAQWVDDDASQEAAVPQWITPAAATHVAAATPAQWAALPAADVNNRGSSDSTLAAGHYAAPHAAFPVLQTTAHAAPYAAFGAGAAGAPLFPKGLDFNNIPSFAFSPAAAPSLGLGSATPTPFGLYGAAPYIQPTGAVTGVTGVIGGVTAEPVKGATATATAAAVFVSAVAAAGGDGEGENGAEVDDLMALLLGEDN